MNRRITLVVFAVAATAAGPALAHHEWPVDLTKRITVEGTVTSFSWANPHVMIALDVQANGTIETWKVGGSSPQFMTTCGWNKKTLKAGDVITVIGYRFKDGSNAAQLQKIVMANGKEMDLYGQLRVLPAAGPISTTAPNAAAVTHR